jgi:hypothetical protein
MSPTAIALGMTALLTVGCRAMEADKAERERPNGSVFYVATDGRDDWSGRLAEPNAAKSDGPFATLARARDAIRELKRRNGGALAEPATVLLRGGLHFLAEPLVLTPEDSGTAQCPVRFAAFQGETPILSGGAPITGWQQKEAGVWEATLPAVREGTWFFRELFIGKAREGASSRLSFERRYRPSQGAFVIAGLTDAPARKVSSRHAQSQDEFRFFPGDLQAWANLDDVEIVALHDWSASRLRIRELDLANHVVRFTGFPVYRIGHWFKGGRNPYYAENVKEAFGKPGEWYLDRPTGRLSYRPLPGEDLAKTMVVVPRVETLVRLAGDPAKERFVEHVAFQGIEFAHAGWTLPKQGYSSRQGMIDLPAAVEAMGARGCRFERCTFAHLGGYALRLGAGCQDNTAIGCRMFDLGGGGVLIGVTDRNAKPPVLPTGNTVANCVISDGGLAHFSANGVWVGITQKTTLSHNVVRRWPYSGIAVGWCWDDKPSSAGNTVIEGNHIHDAMMLLADGGGIYSLGWQPGNVLRGNHIHDIRRSPFAGSAPNNGMFLDEGSKEFLLESNVIYRTAQAPIRFNRSKQELHTWKDNFLGVPPDDTKFPEAAKAIIAQAGLEPAFRGLDAAPPKVPPSPIYAMKLPPSPEPAPGGEKPAKK